MEKASPKKEIEEEIYEDEEENDPNNLENAKRFASIFTAEDCEFLTIPREKFKEILVSVLQKDIDDKIKVLQSLPFLKVILILYSLIIKE